MNRIFTVLLLLFSYLIALTNDSISFNKNQEFAESSFIYNINNADSLYNDWKLKQTSNLSELKKESVNKLLENKEYPDSVIIERLSRIPSVVNLTYNKIVKAHMKVYLQKKREMSETILGLTEYYFPIIEPILDKYKLPYELKYMAIIESALNPRARSRVGASGLWQFMYFTGKSYGLKIDSYIDERYDPVKATKAACEYMIDMYEMFGDWSLVIAAYNCGAGNVKKAIRRSGKRNYWDIYYHLPRETRGYIPAFIAASYMVNYYEYHGLQPKEIEMPLATDTVNVHQNIHFGQISKVIGVPIQTLRRLNPQYKRDVVFGSNYPKILNLPLDKGSSFFEHSDSIVAYNRVEYFKNNRLAPKYNKSKVSIPKNYALLYYTIKKGDNLGYIADWYDTWVSRIKYWNHIRNSRKIKVGQKLKIFVPKSKVTFYSQINKKSFNWKQRNSGANKNTALISGAKNPNNKYYKVKNGDTMWDISQKHGVSVSKIKKLNNIRDHRKIKPGMVLLIKKS
jgi:membrane-bound lytic murein transglycosylase D